MNENWIVHPVFLFAIKRTRKKRELIYKKRYDKRLRDVGKGSTELLVLSIYLL